jgi:hypothetical protein
MKKYELSHSLNANNVDSAGINLLNFFESKELTL